MKKSFKTVCLIMAISSLITMAGCKNKETLNESNINSPSGEITESEMLMTYENNGSSFVKYGNDIYYREYSNTSKEQTGILGSYSDKENEQKPFKKLQADGTTSELFMDQGYDSFYILNSKIFGYHARKLYCTDLKGGAYHEFGEGNYVQADEENHQLYFLNDLSKGNLFVIDTVSLEVSQITNASYPDFLCVYHNNAYYALPDENNKAIVKVMKYDVNRQQEELLLTLTDAREGDQSDFYERCIISKYFVNENKLYAVVGSIEGTGRFFTNGILYEIDLNSKEASILESGVDNRIFLDGNKLYFYYIDNEKGTGCYFYDLEKKTITPEEKEGYLELAKDCIKVYDMNNELVMVLENKERTTIFSKEDEKRLEEKYLASYLEEERMINIINIDKVDSKLFYEIQISVTDPESDIGWRTGYRHIASEIHYYDIQTKIDTILYQYEV